MARLKFPNNPPRRASEYGAAIMEYLGADNKGPSYEFNAAVEPIRSGNDSHYEVFNVTQPGRWLGVAKVARLVTYTGNGEVTVRSRLIPKDKLLQIVEGVRSGNPFRPSKQPETVPQ